MNSMRKTATTRFPNPPRDGHVKISSKTHPLLIGKLLIGSREKQVIKKSISLDQENAKLRVDWKKIKDLAEIILRRTENREASRNVLRTALRIEWHVLLKKQRLVHGRAVKAASAVRTIHSKLTPEERETVKPTLDALIELEKNERKFHEFVEEQLIRTLTGQVDARGIREEIFQTLFLSSKEKIDAEIRTFYEMLKKLNGKSGNTKEVLQFCKALREEHQSKVSLFFGLERLMQLISDLDALSTNNPPTFI